MSCFELVYNTHRFIASLFGKKITALEDFYDRSLTRRNFVEYVKSLTPSQRTSFILMQDKKMFEAWKNSKDLSIQNNLILLVCAFCIVTLLVR